MPHECSAGAGVGGPCLRCSIQGLECHVMGAGLEFKSCCEEDVYETV